MWKYFPVQILKRKAERCHNHQITMKNLWNQYHHNIKYVDNTDPALEGFIIEWVNLCYIRGESF